MLFIANRIGNIIKRSAAFTVCDEIRRGDIVPTSIVIVLESGVLADVLSDLSNSGTPITLFTENGSPLGDETDAEYDFIVRCNVAAQWFNVPVTIYCALATNYAANVIWHTETGPMKDLLVALAADIGYTYNSAGLYDDVNNRVGDDANGIYNGVTPTVPYPSYVEAEP